MMHITPSNSVIKSSITATCVISLLALLASCRQRDHLTTFSRVNPNITDLIPERDALPADTRQTKYTGTFSEAERYGIAKLVGRIKGVDHHVIKVWIYTNEYPIVVKVQLPDHYVYLTVSEPQGTFRLVEISRYFIENGTVN
jgi:hypothetical protein